MFQFVEKHGKVLYEMIRALAADDRKVFYVSGEVDVTDREQIRGIVEKKMTQLLLPLLALSALASTSATCIILYLRLHPSLRSKSCNQLAVVSASLMMVGLLSLLISLMISMSTVIRILH